MAIFRETVRKDYGRIGSHVVGSIEAGFIVDKQFLKNFSIPSRKENTSKNYPTVSS